MATFTNPGIVTSGLAINLDGGNVRSFKGVAATNLIQGITHSHGTSNGTFFKTIAGTEVVNIPTVGRRTVKYLDLYNDYNGGSGQCCPNLFYYHTNVISVSANTTYTYSIIYKTTTEYTHPNFMYRYEYTSGGSYVTEQGVHSTNNRTHLGDGWYHAWNQFTTSATTASLYCYSFYYQYAIWERMYVAAVSITAGSTVPQPKHMLDPGMTIGTTVATGGGWADLTSNSRHGELINGPTHDGGNGGSVVFDGNDDKVLINSFSYTPYCLDFWLYNNSTVPGNDGSIGGPSQYQTLWSPGGSHPGISLGGWTGAATNEALHIWSTSGGNRLTYTRDALVPAIYNWVFNWNGSTYDIWVNGVKQTVYASSGGHAILQSYNTSMYLASDNVTYEFWGKIFTFKMYTSQLTDAQVTQNFNALRARFGV
jgi:hypothetical protein